MVTSGFAASAFVESSSVLTPRSSAPVPPLPLALVPLAPALVVADVAAASALGVGGHVFRDAQRLHAGLARHGLVA